MASRTNPSSGPVSGRALARLLGLSSDNAVRTAVRSGRLRRCIVPGGFDPALAVEEWQASTDPRQQRKVTVATDAAAASDAKRAKAKAAPAKARGRRAAPPADPAPAPEPPGTDDLQERLAAHRAKRLAAMAPNGTPDEEGEAGADGRTMADIRRDMLLVEEEEQAFDWGVKRGLAVPRDPVLAAIQTLGREFRDSTLRIADQYGPQIAADLGVDDYLCHTVLDRYLREHFTKVIAKIDVTRVVADPDADA